MILIIIHHIFVHSIGKQIISDEFINIFGQAHFYRRLSLLQFGQIFGMIGNNLFILISGYFLIEKESVNIKKQSIKIITQQLFCVIILMLFSIISANYFNNDIKSLVGIDYFNIEYWFPGYYLIVIILGELFINKKIKNIDKSKYETILIILFSIISLVFIRGIFGTAANTIIRIITGCLLYLLGGYLKKYNPLKNIKIRYLLLLLLLFNIIIYISYYNYISTQINNFDNLTTFKQTYQSYDIYSIIPISFAIIIFELFSRINIKDNKIINYFASASLMVYLVHDNIIGRAIFNIQKWIPLLHDNIYKFLGLLFVYVVITYMIGTIFYIIYNLIMRKVNKI